MTQKSELKLTMIDHIPSRNKFNTSLPILATNCFWIWLYIRFLMPCCDWMSSQMPWEFNAVAMTNPRTQRRFPWVKKTFVTGGCSRHVRNFRRVISNQPSTAFSLPQCWNVAWVSNVQTGSCLCWVNAPDESSSPPGAHQHRWGNRGKGAPGARSTLRLCSW